MKILIETVATTNLIKKEKTNVSQVGTKYLKIQYPIHQLLITSSFPCEIHSLYQMLRRRYGSRPASRVIRTFSLLQKHPVLFPSLDGKQFDLLELCICTYGKLTVLMIRFIRIELRSRQNYI